MHLSLVQETMPVADDGVKNLLPAEHFSLEQLQEDQNKKMLQTIMGSEHAHRHSDPPDLVVSLLLQQTLVVARNLGPKLLFGLREEIHPGFAFLKESLLLEQQQL